MSNRLLLKSSGTADAVPDFDDLELAELVVNTRNGKMFCKTYDGQTYAIVDLTLSSPDEIIASGSGLIGRSASGSGPAALLSGADAVALLPDATSSAAGKMTAAQVAELYNATHRQLVCRDIFGKNITSFNDYFAFNGFNNGLLQRDTSNGGLTYTYSGVAYSGFDGINTQMEWPSDVLVNILCSFGQSGLYIDIGCCLAGTGLTGGYIFRVTCGSSSVQILKNGSVSATDSLLAALSTGQHEIAIKKLNGVVYGYIDNYEVISYSDNDYQSGRTSASMNVNADGSYTGRLDKYELYQLL